MATALITRRLKAAEPTMVEGPRSLYGSPKPLTASKTERMISGAEEPNAMRVRLAMVGFHTGTSIKNVFSVVSSTTSLTYVLEVITSIASMNMSALIEMPRKR